MSKEFEANMERLFELMAEKSISSMVSQATVKSIDKENDTCVLEREKAADIIDVRLKSVIDDNGNKVVTYPKQGSSVLYIKIGNKSADVFLVAYSEVESIYYKIGDQKLLLNSDVLQFNDGLNGGLINISEQTNKLNALVKEVNALKAHYVAHVHSANGVATVPPFTGNISSFNKSDYEDNNIKH